MAISFGDLENAFLFVSMDQKYMHTAYLCNETGEFFYDSDELPEDIEDPDKYITVPHKNDFELGKTLVIEFTSKYLPEELDRVYSFFRQKGAYSRFKDLLENKGVLKDWYDFEDQLQTIALKEWCRETKIEIKD